MSQIIKITIAALMRCGRSFMRMLRGAFNAILRFILGVVNSPVVRRAAMFVLVFLVSVADIWASSTGAGGFTKATTEINSYQAPVSNLMKAIAAVIVLVGAFNVYFKMQNGDQDVKKTIMMTIGGCVAFIAMSEALPLFFK